MTEIIQFSGSQPNKKCNIEGNSKNTTTQIIIISGSEPSINCNIEVNTDSTTPEIIKFSGPEPRIKSNAEAETDSATTTEMMDDHKVFTSEFRGFLFLARAVGLHSFYRRPNGKLVACVGGLAMSLIFFCLASYGCLKYSVHLVKVAFPTKENGSCIFLLAPALLDFIFTCLVILFNVKNWKIVKRYTLMYEKILVRRPKYFDMHVLVKIVSSAGAAYCSLSLLPDECFNTMAPSMFASYLTIFLFESYMFMFLGSLTALHNTIQEEIENFGWKSCSMDLNTICAKWLFLKKLVLLHNQVILGITKDKYK